jgi:hypothetical protein
MAVRRETMPDGRGREAVRGMSPSTLRSSISLNGLSLAMSVWNCEGLRTSWYSRWSE